jgi:uncharacterized protein DUF1259
MPSSLFLSGPATISKQPHPLLAVACLAALLACRPCFAAEVDADAIARITGLQPDVKGGVAKVSVPRNDLNIIVDGVKVSPFQGLTSWAAFQPAGDGTMVMGDLTLTEAEVNPTMSAALDNGLEVTALHNHFFYSRPAVFFMHIGGHGTTEALATGVRKALDAAKDARATTDEGFGSSPIPERSTVDTKTLTSILGEPAQEKDGMVKFVFGKKTAMHGTDAGAAMGVNTWAAFAGSPEAAVVDGDFAMLESELQSVLKALRHAQINVVAIHNHMTDEQPRIMFLHFWAKGRADDLARGVKSAIATQAQ